MVSEKTLNDTLYGMEYDSELYAFLSFEYGYNLCIVKTRKGFKITSIYGGSEIIPELGISENSYIDRHGFELIRPYMEIIYIIKKDEILDAYRKILSLYEKEEKCKSKIFKWFRRSISHTRNGLCDAVFLQFSKNIINVDQYNTLITHISCDSNICQKYSYWWDKDLLKPRIEWLKEKISSLESEEENIMLGFDNLIRILQKILTVYENEQHLPIEKRVYTKSSIDECIALMRKHKNLKWIDKVILSQYINLCRRKGKLNFKYWWWKDGDSKNAIECLNYHIKWHKSSTFRNKYKKYYYGRI